MKTLASEFAKLREKSGYSMLMTAELCQVAETTVWKVEHGLSVRWETIHLLLVVAFKIAPDSKQYAEFNRLWLQSRAKMAESQGPEFASKKLPPYKVAAIRKFRKIIAGLNKERVSAVMEAVEEITKP